jgi:hypothetical protein
MNNYNYIIPHHLKGVKHYNKNIKKRLTYLKLIVFSVQYAIRIRISLDFCGNGNRKESDFLLLKKDFLIKGGNHRSYIHRVPLFCEVVKYYE